MAMDKSAGNMLKQTALRERRRDALNQEQMSRSRVWTCDDSLEDLTNFMASLMATFQDESRHWLVHQVSDTSWLAHCAKEKMVRSDAVLNCRSYTMTLRRSYKVS